MAWRKYLFHCIGYLSAFSVLLWVPACGRSSGPSEETAKAQQAIINGQPNNAYPAAGSLTAAQRSFCSGTLIAPRVVLTAAHCIDAFAQTGGAALEFRVDVPVDQRNYKSIFVPIDQTNSKRHPNYDRQQVLNDIAVVILTRGVFEVPSVPFNTQKMDASWVGRELFFMGYGRLSASDTNPAPFKYSTKMPITGVDPTSPQGPKTNTVSYLGNNTAVCQGDSGGPAMYENNGKMYVVAVTSHGTSLNCNGTSYSYRTDPYVAWIQGFVDQFSTCEGANPTCGKCASCDANKQCVPKSVSADPKNCAVCNSDADCPNNGSCVQIGSGKRCAQACDGDDCCPADHVCTTGLNSKKYCLPNKMECPPVSCTQNSQCSAGETCKSGTCAIQLPTRKATLCQPCATNADCGGDYCENPEGRGGRCLQPCDASDRCPENFRCKDIAPGFKQCIANDGVCRSVCKTDADCKGGLLCDTRDGVCKRDGGGDPGEPCAQDLPCKPTLQCTPASEGARCYQTCGFAPGSAGSPCRPNGTCDAGLQCFQNPAGGGNFCVEPCSTGTTCNTGGSCAPFINICFCQNDAACGAGRSCNLILQGLGGACTAAVAKPCPQGEECISNPGQQSICVQNSAGSQDVGQACDAVKRCKKGLLCLPGLNVCVEDCTQTNTCTQGGKCQSIQFVPNKFCTCGQPADCPSGKLCRVVGQGIGFCAPDDSKGCQSTGCPSGFKCVGTQCVSENAEPLPEPDAEPPVESVAEPSAEPTAEPTAETTSESSAEASPDGGTADKGSGTDETTSESNIPPKSCGCQQPTPSEIPASFVFLLFFLATLQLRRR
ncbi:trypsin-like serine protease [Myxococcota bacterium]|nr:trypsin-like serine protease [Myxococcota bacterium]